MLILPSSPLMRVSNRHSSSWALGAAPRRRKRRREPLVERIGRLDVVMPVDQQRRCAGNVGTLPPHDRMRFTAEVLDVRAPEPCELRTDPSGGGATISVVSRKSRD